jgi:hypothetical protein
LVYKYDGYFFVVYLVGLLFGASLIIVNTIRYLNAKGDKKIKDEAKKGVFLTIAYLFLWTVLYVFFVILALGSTGGDTVNTINGLLNFIF